MICPLKGNVKQIYQNCNQCNHFDGKVKDVEHVEKIIHRFKLILMETDLEIFVRSKKTLMDRKCIRECIDTRFFGTSIDSMINKVAIDNRHCYLK